MNTEAPSIDLEVLERVSRELIEALDREDGSNLVPAITAFEMEALPERVLALVAAVKALQRVRACRTSKGWTIGGHPGLTQLLPEMDAALQPFIGPKPQPEPEMIPRRWSRDDDEDLQSLMDRDMGDS